MRLAEKLLPAGYRFRELWLPEQMIEETSIPNAIDNGHPLALTGAKRGSTVDGVKFHDDLASNINCGAIHDASAKLWVSLRFKLDQDFSVAATEDQWLWNKRIDGNDRLGLYLESDDGKLYWVKFTGGVPDFQITSVATSWNAGQWYHVLASISDTVGIGRLAVDDGTPVLTADVSATPNGGDVVIGDFDDPGGTGFNGIIADIVMGTDDLSDAEETDLSRGIPPVDAVNFWPLDEGRGTTVYDRGSGGNNGTIDTVATWAWGKVKLPALSLDGINDRGASPSGVDITGDLTLIWVGKMKSTYNALINPKDIFRLYIVNNYFLLRYDPGVGAIYFDLVGGGSAGANAELAFTPAIDDYWIMVGTLVSPDETALFVNGSLGATGGAGADAMAGAAVFHLGSDQIPTLTRLDISKPLMVGLVDGALNEKEVRRFSRNINDLLGLGLTI